MSDLDIARALAEFRALGASRRDQARSGPDTLRTSAASPAPQPAWTSESLEDRRFDGPHARLFPFIGRKVRTPKGAGVLQQVFRDRCAVALDAEAQSYLHFFPPTEIEPVSWLVGNEDFSPKSLKRVLEGRRGVSSRRANDDH